MGSAGGMYYYVAELGGFTGLYIMGAPVVAAGNFVPGMVFLTALSMIADSRDLLPIVHHGSG